MKTLLISILLATSLLTPPVFAQRPDAPAYAQRGPYAVGTQDFTIEDDHRPLEVAIWYPASNLDELDEVTEYRYSVFRLPGNAIRDADPANDAAPFPVVLFSHGNAGLRYQSTFLMEHLASYGFIVAAIDHPTNSLLDTANETQFGRDMASNLVHRPKDLVRLYDFVLSLNETEEFAGLIDPDTLALSGHSFGGYTALASAGATLNLTQLAQICIQLQTMEGMADGACWLPEQADEMLSVLNLDVAPENAWPEFADLSPDAIALLAPWNGPVFDAARLSTLLVPTLFMIGTGDSITPAQRDAYFLYQQMTSAPLTLVSLEMAGHYVFVDKCIDIALQLGLFEQCSDPIWDMDRAHDLIKHFTTSFLLAELENDENARIALDNSQETPGVNIFQTPGSFAAQFANIERLVPEVLGRIEHDEGAWTQGLLFYDGALYESTGHYAESTLRRLNPATGEIEQIISLADEYFGEGLARVENRLFQITWREQTAIVYDLATFEPLQEFTYEGEGWGICFDGEHLFMSNGSSEITRRSPETFEAQHLYTVTANGQPISQLNELECVGDEIYANVLNEDLIVRFNKSTGAVNAYIDTREMRLPDEISGNVLNGIAHDPNTGEFYLTGKYWPLIYRVRLASDLGD